MFQTIKPGDRVTIKTRLRGTICGRAVMKNRAFAAWVLNTGGRNGIPALATAANTLEVKACKSDKFARTAAIINGRGV